MLPMIGGTLSSLQHGGSSVRAIRDGLAYRSAVLAAELALRGVHGDRRVLEGPFDPRQGNYAVAGSAEIDRVFSTARSVCEPTPHPTSGAAGAWDS